MRLALWFTERRELLESSVTMAAQLHLARAENAAAKAALRVAAVQRDLALHRGNDLASVNLDLRAEVVILRRQVETLLVFTPSDLREMDR